MKYSYQYSNANGAGMNGYLDRLRSRNVALSVIHPIGINRISGNLNNNKAGPVITTPNRRRETRCTDHRYPQQPLYHVTKLASTETITPITTLTGAVNIARPVLIANCRSVLRTYPREYRGSRKGDRYIEGWQPANISRRQLIMQPLTALLRWDNEDPATPALIEPLMEDCYGIKNTNQTRSQEMTVALDMTKEYCRHRIKQYKDEGFDALTMGEMSTEAEHFLNGHMAALTGNIESH